LRGIAVKLVLAWINMNQRLPLMDEFIVRHVERNDEPRDPRRYGYRPPVRIGIVGRFNIAGQKPIINSAANQQSENEDAAQKYAAAPFARSAFFIFLRQHVPEDARLDTIVFGALGAGVAARLVSVVSLYFFVEERARHELYRRLFEARVNCLDQSVPQRDNVGMAKK